MSRRDLSQRYWDAYEASLEPPPGSAARNLARIRQRIEAGEAVDEAPPPAESRARRVAACVVLLGKPAALSVGIATATLLSIKLAVMGWSQLAAAPPSAAPVVERPDRAKRSGTRPVSHGRAEPSPPVAAAAEPTPAEPTSADPSSADGGRSTPAAAPEPSRRVDGGAVADRLRAEVALMDRARAALEQGDAEALWRSMDEHARRFPAGALAEERRAWQAVAACQLGHARAAVRAREFLAAHPRSPQADKVRHACALEVPRERPIE